MSKKVSFKNLFPVILLSIVNILGFSILIPVLPFIVEENGGSDIFYGLLMSIYSLFQFLAAPLLGSLSDIFGRKPILIISQLGTLVSWIIFGIAWFLPHDVYWLGVSLPLWVILFSRVLDGATGGNVSVLSAYVSDVVEAKNRSQAFAMIGATTGIGMLIGPVLGGLTAGSGIGYLATAIFSTAISLFAFVLIFSLKESLPVDKHVNKFNFKKITSEFNLFKKFSSYKNNPIVFRTFQIALIFGLSFTAYTSIIVLVFRDVFELNEIQVGLFMMAVGLSMFVNQMFFAKKLIAKIGDYKALSLGLALIPINFLLATWVSSTGMLSLFVVVMLVMTFSVSLVFPTIKSILVNNADEKRRGEVTGLEESINSLARTIAPIAAGVIYFELSYFSFPTFAFLMLFALVLSQKLYKDNHNG